MVDGHIYVGDLSERHQRAIRAFVDRYRRGAAEHGDLTRNRKWTRDMLEEGVDLTFYLIFELLEMEDSVPDLAVVPVRAE